MCSERWILVAEMCDSLQNKYQDNTVPVCNRDDQKTITATKASRTEKVDPNRNVPAFTGLRGGKGEPGSIHGPDISSTCLGTVVIWLSPPR
jgi:hypothetical protein